MLQAKTWKFGKAELDRHQKEIQRCEDQLKQLTKWEAYSEQIAAE